MKCGELRFQRGHSVAGATVAAMRQADGSFELRFENAWPARAIEIAILEEFRLLTCGFVLRVEAHIASHEVGVPVAIEISSCHAAPPSC